MTTNKSWLLRGTLICLICAQLSIGAAQQIITPDEQSPYLPNIWDNRLLQKAEQRFARLAEEGNKEQLVQIIWTLKNKLAVLTDAKSQYILFTLAGLAEQQLPTAIQQATNPTPVASWTNNTSTKEETPTKQTPSPIEENTEETGQASYYGSAFDGRGTANGDIFSNAELTAAHKTLPFNTLVKVTNTNNNLRVIVRINDRGPYTPWRIIDLSQAAFKAINNDSLRAWILPVSISVVTTDE